MSRKGTVPAYTLHKATGQARVRINGKDHYLGEYRSPESRERYSELIAQWQRQATSTPTDVTVGQLSMMFMGWAETHYVKNGHQTSEVGLLRDALKRLNRIAAMMPVDDIRPRILKQVREPMITSGLARTTINATVRRIRRVVKWGVGEEIVRAETLVALQAVPDLKRGRSAAKETEHVKPAPRAHIEAIEGHVMSAVWAMVQLQLVTGMRPGEVRIMRACDIDMSGNVWIYRPETHKTEHHGCDRVVVIGPHGQEIIRDWLTLDLHAPLFSTPQGNTYRKDSYRNAIFRGCRKADVPPWFPNQLRHNFATDARQAGGLEAAKVMLGHSNMSTTEIYAERDLAKAAEIVARIG